MKDTKNKKRSAKLLAIAIAAALALSAAPVLAEDKTPVDLEGTITGWQEGDGGTGSLEVGSANADGKMSIAVGESTSTLDGATANGTSSIAIGGALASSLLGDSEGAFADGVAAIAVGTGAQASAEDATAIGRGATASGKDSIAIGSTYSSGITAGVTTASGNRAVAIGSNAQATATLTTALGENSQASGANAVAVGSSAKATHESAIAIGYDTKANGKYSIAIGEKAIANEDNVETQSVAIGYTSKVQGTTQFAVALGAHSVATEDKTVSIGNSSGSGYFIRRRLVNMDAGRSDYEAVNVSQLKNTLDIFGNSTEVNTRDGLITNKGFTYRGYNDLTTVQNVFNKIDSDIDELYSKIGTSGDSGPTGEISWDATTTETGTCGSTADAGTTTTSTIQNGGEVTFVGGKNGNITVTQTPQNTDEPTGTTIEIDITDKPAFTEVSATDKVTVGTDGDKTLIDGGTVTVDKKITVGGEKGATTITDGGAEFGTEGDKTAIAKGRATFTAASGSTEISGNSATFSDSAGGSLAVSSSAISINNDSAYFREKSMKVGSMTYDGGANRLDMGGSGRISGLADGGVYRGSTDAVTGNQLWDAYQRMGALEGDIYNRLGDMQESINIVGAHAAALSGLHPIDYNPYEPTTLSAAVGTYRDEYAVAVGVFHYVRENVLFNLGASLCSDGDVMGRAGISFTVGKDMKRKPMLARDMAGMQQQMIAMQAKVEELEEKNAKNEAIIRQNAEIMKQNEKLIRELTKRLEAKK